MIQYTDFLQMKGAEDKGNYIVATCPFHSDNSPSLLIYKDGWFHCLAADCARSGTWKTLWNKIKGQPVQVQVERRINYSTPKHIIAEAGVPEEELVYQAHMDLIHFPTFQWYLELRGLVDAIDIHEIGYRRGWYSIPVRDVNGRYVTTVWRSNPHVQMATGYRYWSASKPTMYVPDWRLIDKSDQIIVVIGMLDALTLNLHRYPVVTPTAGYNFNPGWLDNYNKPIYVIPDRKEEKAALSMVAQLGWRGHMVYLDYPEGIKDANDFLVKGKMDDLIAQLSVHIR